MKKLFHTLTMLVGLGALSTLAGCELYFGHGDGGGGGNWNYCGSDGYYQCENDNCTWVSSTCPAGSGSGNGSGSGSGYDCSSNTDCAAGCYCQSGTCEEGGFCSTDADCGSGFHCDTQRSSCEPNAGGTCDYDNQCPQGQYCAPDHTCTATCSCTNDSEAIAQGFGWCDESRGTCLPGQDPAGSCGSAITCNTAMPTCPAGQIALTIDGCWTGACRDLAACDVTPQCQRINDENDCLDRASDCSTSYTGLNCRHADGTACHSGDTGCTCDSYIFANCVDKTASMGRVIQNSQGQWIDASPFLLTNQ